MIFRICKTVMVFYQFSESISGEYHVRKCNHTVTVGFCGRVSADEHLRTGACKHSCLNRFIREHSTLNGIEKPQNPKDFFCNSNHRFSKFLAGLSKRNHFSPSRRLALTSLTWRCWAMIEGHWILLCKSSPKKIALQFDWNSRDIFKEEIFIQSEEPLGVNLSGESSDTSVVTVH